MSPTPQPDGSGGAAASTEGDAPFTVTAPTVELPKGGGAIRGIGEKFAANPVTGTGSMTVPIAISPGRTGFGPQFSLSYDSGAGNGVFGFGWTLGLPHVSRKTDTGLPRYDDANESDVFLPSGAEDLVPVLNADGSRAEDRTDAPGYVIHRYRPRIEGLFARIERWTRLADADVHWRSISSDNVLTVYGKDARSRVADPLDPTRVFTWLICETRDDRGNAVVYDYKPEDGDGVDLTQAHERNRGSRDDRGRTANRYLKRVRYGNRSPVLDDSGQRPFLLTDRQIESADWLFEVVFDYGEHDRSAPRPDDTAPWALRADAFSTYRSGFEIRTSRRCSRVLMFHHFDQEPGVGRDCLVRSTDFGYADESAPSDPHYPIHSFLRSVTHCGYRRDGPGYLRGSLPPMEFHYSLPTVQSTVEVVDAASLANLPAGLDGAAYQWIDLHGEGVPGLLTEEADAWYYKRNLSPLHDRAVELAPVELVATKPNFGLAGGSAQLLDLAGDGRPDLVVLDGPIAGFHEHDDAEGWAPFRAFSAVLNRDTADPNLRFIDLDGDGHADLLITEDDAFVWHASLANDGFGAGQRTYQGLDEESGPRIVFADADQSIYLADLSGDGLTDLVRIRNGEVCYWPNLGYGRFGTKISMDSAPRFDRPDLFDQRRIRVADIDGSGASDLIYLADDGVTLYFNQSGNAWSAPQRVAAFPAVDGLAAIQVLDLLGNGTACLVWSSPLTADATTQLRYVNLMGEQKPHLLVGSANNLGIETVVHYASSTRFYLADRLAGRPWITRLPFPVHVVDRVEIHDRVSGNRFVSRSAYHHGYFDGTEREFRGFGMIEQWDTEEYAAFSAGPVASNVDSASHVPPVLTRTWFHTGACLDRQRISQLYSADYYREPGLTDGDAQAMLLADTVLPAGLTLDEEREACRALKGTMLRQEVFALDGGDREPHPYSVIEQNATIRLIQPSAGNRHAVFLAHPREAITYQYERNPADPRTMHRLTLEVDDYGNVVTSAAVAYGRRQPETTLSSRDQDEQAAQHITGTQADYTNAIDTIGTYRTPLSSESRTFELAGVQGGGAAPRLAFAEVYEAMQAAEPIDYEQPFTPDRVQKRLIEHVRTRYRPDDLGAAAGDPLALLEPGTLEPLALPGESYRLAFTSGLVAQRFGDKVSDPMLENDGNYLQDQDDQSWWLRSGRTFLSPVNADDPATELAFARRHFFQAHRFRDPFHRSGFETESVAAFDPYDLSIVETRNALGNTVRISHDYRVLQPYLLTDPNGNRTEVAFDALGMVTGTAAMGKEAEALGDSLAGFTADLDEATIAAYLDDPFSNAASILQRASTRLVYDVFAYQRSQDQRQPHPAVVSTLARTTHDSDLASGEVTGIQHALSYSDGFGREIQQKLQAEPASGTTGDTSMDPRWIGSGWTVFNNKGKPVRRYEPFFTETHEFEFARTQGVSPVLCYDPPGRLVTTLHPDHSWQKLVVDAWRQETWDVNDTVLIADPREDPDVADHFRRLPVADFLPTWYAERADGAMGADEAAAAAKAAAHAGTPAVAHLDSLGRTILTVAHNRLTAADALGTDPPDAAFYETRSVFDIEGNQLAVIDALDRSVLRYDYDMLGNRVHSVDMDAGERWMLNDVVGRPLYGWDSRGHRQRTGHDVVGRPVTVHLQDGGDAAELLVGRILYGETVSDAQTLNLRGKPYQSFDGAGVLTTGRYDFKGNALSSTRQFAAAYTTTPNWSGTVALEPQVFTADTRLDALNRPVMQTTPDGSAIRRTYNQAGLLETVEANLGGQQDAGQPVWRPFVTDLDYNPKGQRQRIDYGNGCVTSYTYDPLTFRLVRLQTMRGRDRLQDLSYTYDAVGNITHIEDAAQQTIYFRNTVVEPSNDYTYDATYQLIEATGREHLGQLSAGRHHPGDGTAMGRYVERYVYDPVGDLLEMRHIGSDPAHPGWTRRYDYSEPSLLETASHNSRLSSTQVGGGPIETYTHDPHGNMTSMPQLGLMRWNHQDQLAASARQIAHSGSPETTYYVYDGSGQRARKVTEWAAGSGEAATRKSERSYVGGLEIYRKYDRNGTVAVSQWNTLHIMADDKRIAMVETRVLPDDGPVAPLFRFQMANHLGSVGAELDEGGQLISYEEFRPYGDSAYQAVDARIRATAKRYRYTGMENDLENGLNYHGARYYSPVLGRWTSCDPDKRFHPYSYVANNPTGRTDPGGRAPLLLSLIADTPPPPSPAPPTEPRPDWNMPGNGVAIQSSPLDLVAYSPVMQGLSAIAGQLSSAGRNWLENQYWSPGVPVIPQAAFDAYDYEKDLVTKALSHPTMQGGLSVAGEVGAVAGVLGEARAVSTLDIPEAPPKPTVARSVESAPVIEKAEVQAVAGPEAEPSPAASPRRSKSTGTTGSAPMITLSTRADIVREIRGVTAKIDEIADAIDSGKIKINMLGSALFDQAAELRGIDPADIPSTAAFQLGDNIYLRKDAPSADLLKATVHEGVHALDELRGMKAGEGAWEVRAYMQEYLFAKAKGLPTFRSVQHMMQHIEGGYGWTAGWRY